MNNEHPENSGLLQTGTGGHGTLEQGVESTSRIMEVKRALGLPLDKPVPMSPNEIHEVDDLQDDLMASKSPEGRPPRHDLRLAEWRWLLLAVGVVLTGALIWAIAGGIAPWWIGIGSLLLICLLGIGISPVLYAGLLRGGEERDARKTAAAVVKHSASLNPPPPH
jgi:hypothetical protein